MYSEEDINSAVAAGALTPEAAASFRAHMTQVREMPRGDEENFRLINSFNDIFVAIGAIIMLLAASAIGQQIAGIFAPVPTYPGMTGQDLSEAQWNAWQAAQGLRTAMNLIFGGILVAATAWGLAEFFTRRRRMALPSIILLLAYVCAVFATFLGIGLALGGEPQTGEAGGIIASVAGLFAAGAAWVHWRRFMVPITVAAGAGAIAVTVLSFVFTLLDAAGMDRPFDAVLWFIFAAGLAIFAFAMRWDMSDPARTTRRSDVAFWLHLLAAPMLAHPLFYSLGVMDGGDAVGVGGALGVIAVYILFGVVALAVDRRALLVSALAYVLAALTFLFDRFGAVELNFALTALIIGSALLTLSAFWTPIRGKVVRMLPTEWRDRLPEIGALPATASA
ncbi:LPXTG cell wall anchor domain-containing protein [Erythrobacter sp. 3-20A1M]|uniref:LPXTG cell wall anchor domain-containing protein n=1 Tax=Erythrobacter sp. 3-20A1M TaxID=2653850 RepID=UPI001BFCB649|nr:LPXTG cell wall anchor domain-containing protein [Erythrobacter sp. 3-20A1M]QWC56055.1 LPXTG cell wall anchor domain-containing protein [Erythrobacter sp. 3-20A1M]